MIIAAAQVTIHVPWVHSLKEKRMEVKSLCAKIRSKFNVSIAEVDLNDVHQQIGLGFASVVNDSKVADSIIDNVLNFLEGLTEGEIIQVNRELR